MEESSWLNITLVHVINNKYWCQTVDWPVTISEEYIMVRGVILSNLGVVDILVELGYFTDLTTLAQLNLHLSLAASMSAEDRKFRQKIWSDMMPDANETIAGLSYRRFAIEVVNSLRETPYCELDEF